MSTWQEEYKAVVLKGVVALVVAAVAAWVFIVPAFKQSAGLQQRIEQAEQDLQRQQVLLPEYLRVQQLLAAEPLAGLTVPDPEAVDVGDIDMLPPHLARLAMDSGMEVLDVVVSPGSLRTGSGRMMMQCVVFGEQGGFRDFFLALGEQPFVDHVDRVDMRAVPGGVEFFLQFWVLLNEAKAG